MKITRVRNCENKKEYQRVLDDLYSQGYENLIQGDFSTTLRKKDHGSVAGHALIFLFFFWTFLIANIIYALVCKYTAEKVLVKVSADETSNEMEMTKESV